MLAKIDTNESAKFDFIAQAVRRLVVQDEANECRANDDYTILHAGKIVYGIHRDADVLDHTHVLITHRRRYLYSTTIK
jgi:hypothetical protein